jgi:hypothetical protein
MLTLLKQQHATIALNDIISVIRWWHCRLG